MGRRSFIDIGYQKLKDIAEGCNKHENSKRHENAIEAWRNYKLSELSSDDSISIKRSLITISNKEKADNREQIKIVFDAIILLARMRQGFRSDNESKDSPNRGNLFEMLNYSKNTLNQMLLQNSSADMETIPAPKFETSVYISLAKKCKLT